MPACAPAQIAVCLIGVRVTEREEGIVSGGGWKSRQHADREHVGYLLGIGTFSGLIGAVLVVGGLAMDHGGHWFIGGGLLGLMVMPIFWKMARRADLDAQTRDVQETSSSHASTE